MGAQVGLVGLAVMGQNLALNIERNGFPIAVFNRTGARTKEFIEGPAAGKQFTAAYTLEELVAAIDRPRKIILMVQAGKAGGRADRAAQAAAGGRRHPGRTPATRCSRTPSAAAASLTGPACNYVGMGVSGGEEGALWGPSIMPGGSKEAYAALEPILTAIAAKSDYGACVSHIGPRGAGHYVKMVHNGIEYGDMQLIAETYSLMQHALGPLGAADGRGLHALEQRRPRLVPDRDHGERAGVHGPRHRQAAGGRDPGQGRPEGDRALDVPGRPGAWHADPDHRRGGLVAQHLVVQGRARPGERDPERPRGRGRQPWRRRRGLPEGPGGGALGGEGQQLRPGDGRCCRPPRASATTA